MREGRSVTFYILVAVFAAYVLFLYGPMIAIFILSFQGPTGGLTFPMNGVSLHWFARVFVGNGTVDIGSAFARSLALGLVAQPQEWLLYSEFSVVLALVHLFTFFMIVPIFNSMMRIDRSLIEAAYDAGASGWQTLWNVVIPLCKPGIVIGSIFVITIVMGDFITVGVMGGQQIASVGKLIETRLNALQFPPAAANAVLLLGLTALIIGVLSRLVDVRKEL